MFHPQGPTFWELASQALSSTERGYDLLAPKFDFTPFRTPDCLLADVAPIIAECQPCHSGIDLCCGTGAATRVLANLCDDRVVGIDFSENMLGVARDQPGQTEAAEIEYLRGDVLEMEFDEEFDVAVCFGALGHILPQDQRRFAARVARSLRPGGRFCFATCSLPPRTSRQYWLSRGFNAAMRLRNLLVRPPFVMYYLTFLVPEVNQILVEAGFEVDVRQQVFAPPFQQMCVVVATKKERAPSL